MTDIQQGSTVDERTVTPVHLPAQFVNKFISADATPSVMDCVNHECHATIVTITQFDDGQDGQTIKLLGKATTTIANNANIATNTGANKVLAANKVYTFTRFNSKWIE